MAEKDKGGVGEIVPGQKMEGHGDSTQPAGIISPATFVPLSQEPRGVNSKTETGRKGKES